MTIPRWDGAEKYKKADMNTTMPRPKTPAARATNHVTDPSVVDWIQYETGEHRIECPICGRGGRDKTAGLTIKGDGKGVLHCHRCHYVESHSPTHKAVCRAPTIKAMSTPQDKKHEHLSDWGRTLWRDCYPISGGIDEQYVKARHCVIPPQDGHLRWHPAVKHPSGYTGPALVALITNVVTSEPMSLHRTWITATGKADVDPPRLLLGAHRKQGGCIRLWPDDAVTHGLAVAEGIETALSLAHAYSPVWSLIDAGNLAELPVLGGVETLVIAADNDPAGRSAASTCARRWADAGREVLVTRQQQNDLNDVLQEVA